MLAFFNIAATAVPNHRASAGVGYTLSEKWAVDMTYYHVFEEDITGQFVSPGGDVPGTEVNTRLSENSIALQLTRFFGK